MVEKNEITITPEMYMGLLKKYEQVLSELDLFKQKSPIVGVRWFGKGGTSIGLTYAVAGQTRVVLEGYGSKAVIDYPTWIRMRTSEEARVGVLVRDDSVIAELGVSGIIGEPDKKRNPNALLDEEIIILLKGNVGDLKKKVEAFTNHFPALHMLMVAKEIGFNDLSKLSIIRDKYRYLLTKFKISLLHHHDLTLSCELYNISFDNKTDEQMIEELTQIELKALGNDFYDPTGN